jgi:hypothetical protein
VCGMGGWDPPTLPLWVLMPSRRAELPSTHDLCADARSEQLRKGVVDAAGAAGLADTLVPPPGGEHPFVQPVAGVAERRVEALTFAGGETVERDGEVLDAGERHGWGPFGDRGQCSSVVGTRWLVATFGLFELGSVISRRSESAPLDVFAVLSPYFADTLLADSADLAGFLDAELTALVKLALDVEATKLLTGMPSNYSGSALESIRKAATLIQNGGFAPDTVFVSNFDAEGLDLATDDNGAYVLDVRTKDSSPVWSLDVVASVAIPAGTGIVVDRTAAATAFLRSQVRIAIDAESRFEFDEARARAEARGHFALQRPGAVAVADLTA